MDRTTRTGGCLCGTVRYEARGEPRFAGLCYCEDCRRASGGGCIPFMSYESADFRVAGETKQVRKTLADGRVSVRNICASCGSLLFGGEYGTDSQHTVYAGTLDDPSLFKPEVAIMTRDRPAWAALPPGLRVFEAMPG